VISPNETATHQPKDPIVADLGHDGFTPVVTAAVFVLFLVMGVLVAAMGAALPRLRTQFHDPMGLDTLVSLYSLGACVAIVGCGVIRRWVGPVRLITSGQIVLAIGCVGMAVARDWPGFLASAVIAGLGAGVLMLYLNTAVARGFGAKAVVAVNVLNAGFGIGAVLGPIIIGALDRSGIRLVAGVAAISVLGCLAARSAGRVLPERPTPPGSGPHRPSGITASARWAPIVAVGFLYAGVELSVGAWEASYLTWNGYAATTAASWVAAFWGGLAVGRLVLPALLARLVPHRAIQLYLLAAVVAVMVTLIPSAAPIGFALVGLAFGPILPTTIVWLSRTADRPEKANSWLFTATLLGNAVVPALVATIADEGRARVVPLAVAAGCLICLVVAAIAGRSPDSAGLSGRSHQL
jgi:fucose permease